MDDNLKKTILIAVPTNDCKNIFPKMLGMAKYFYIYKSTPEIPIEFFEKRLNPYETTLQHLKTLDVYDIIKDCDIIIAAFIGKKGIKRLEAKGMRLFLRIGAISEALKNDPFYE